MTTKIVIIVYNRIENVRRWLHCWKQCNQANTELIFIHNSDTDQPDYRELVESNACTYIQRPNIGYDIGAFQDVCRNRLPGFPEWERLLWCCDDTWPMNKHFAQLFDKAMTKGVGVACMQVSPEVRTHIRTTGFMIDRSTAERLTFEVDPITTKEDCYRFEHRLPDHHFHAQIIAMGLKVVQVAPNSASPLWDSEYKRRLNRLVKHIQMFGKVRAPKPVKEPTEPKITVFIKPENYSGRAKATEIPDSGFKGIPITEPVITFICPIYHGYPQIVSSLLMQTNPNWLLWLIHDGPGKVEGLPIDDRIQVIYTNERRGNWGHSYRAEYLQKVETEFVAITNNDNYHAPVYIEYLVKGFTNGQVGAYCSDMVHSYVKWKVIPCRLERGFIDCAGMVLRTKEAQAVGWNDVVSHSADWFFFEDLIKRYGRGKFVKVNGCMLVHNVVFFIVFSSIILWQ